MSGSEGCVCVCVCVRTRAATALGLFPTLSASLVLDRGHVPSVLTMCCDSSAGAEVTCGSRLREDHQLLSARSVTSCQLDSVSKGDWVMKTVLNGPSNQLTVKLYGLSCAQV